MFTIALWRMPSIIPQKLRDARKARILEIQEIKHALVIRDFLRGATLQGKSQKHLYDEVVKERKEEAEEGKIENEEQDEDVQKEESKEKEGAESQGQEQKEDKEDVEQSSNEVNQSGQEFEEFNSSVS